MGGLVVYDNAEFLHDFKSLFLLKAFRKALVLVLVHK